MCNHRMSSVIPLMSVSSSPSQFLMHHARLFIFPFNYRIGHTYLAAFESIGYARNVCMCVFLSLCCYLEETYHGINLFVLRELFTRNVISHTTMVDTIVSEDNHHHHHHQWTLLGLWIEHRADMCHLAVSWSLLVEHVCSSSLRSCLSVPISVSHNEQSLVAKESRMKRTKMRALTSQREKMLIDRCNNKAKTLAFTQPWCSNPNNIATVLISDRHIN